MPANVPLLSSAPRERVRMLPQSGQDIDVFDVVKLAPKHCVIDALQTRTWKACTDTCVCYLIWPNLRDYVVREKCEKVMRRLNGERRRRKMIEPKIDS